MENGYTGVSNNDVATLALAGRGIGGGYGYGGGGHGREYANDGSNAVRINSNQTLAALSHDSLSQQISDNADRNRDIAVTQQNDAHFTALTEKINDQTRFFSGEVNALAREQVANARETAKCCCEAQLLAVQNQAKTDAGLATLLANQECTKQVADAVANAQQNAKLDNLLAAQGNHGS